MSGEFGSGTADRARTPKPPDKPAVPPDAQKSQQDTSHPANQQAQPDGKRGKDNHAPTGPPGGKPPEMGPKGDAGQHQAGDKSGDTHRSGDGPVKISEVPGPRNADGPRHGGHQPPGPQLSTNPAQWKAQFESHWVAPHPERAMVPATEIKHRVELPPIGFTHTLDLNKCRDKNGNLDLTKLQAASRRIVKTDVGMAQPERPRPGHPPPAGVGNRELRVQPVDITLHLMNKKSDSETVLVRAVFHEVAKTVTNWDVRTHVDPPSPLRPDPPGPKPGPEPRPGPRMPRPGTDHPQPRSDHVEIHQPGQAPRQVPPVRQMPHVQPHTPWR